jgi:predicted NBD/HSP70 family sugar kinase
MTSPTATAAKSGTTDQLRRDNLSAVLHLVHRENALSRAELTQLTRLNRSTVGDLVAELAELRLVEETAPVGAARAGRPSPVVRVGASTVAIAVNPEVDALILGMVGMGGHVLKRIRIETASVRTASEVVTLASAAIAGMLAGVDDSVRVAGIGVAVPGQVRLADGMVREATHFGWADEPLAAMLEAATGKRVWAANAAVLGMRAESAFGAGRGIDDLVYFIGGPSGIGGGVVSGGRLVTGAAGYAGEFGHTFVHSDGLACHCGARGCLEAEVTQDALMTAVGLSSAEAAGLADALAASSDPAVAALVARDLDLLSIAVRNAVNVFNPSVVVLGGFLADLYRGASRDAEVDILGSVVRSARDGLQVRLAELGADQLLIGAAELVFADLIADPARALLA